MNGGRRGTAPPFIRSFWSSGAPSLPYRLVSSRGRQTSQVPESTLYTHAPLSDPGWLDDTTATECLRVLPSACLHRVGFPRLYNFSGFNDAACVLATTVLHGSPHGVPRRIRYRPADGLWSGGTCTHWLIMTNFRERPLLPIPRSQLYYFILAHPFRLLDPVRAGKLPLRLWELLVCPCPTQRRKHTTRG